VFETRIQVEEDKTIEQSAKNVIIYRVPESKEGTHERRNIKYYVHQMFKTLISQDFEETEIVKMFRLGNLGDLFDQPKTQSILVQLQNKMTKNLLMNQLSKMRESEYKDIVISNDMSPLEREQCKKLVLEAKKMESDESSGEFVYRVRGPPGQMKKVRLKKATKRDKEDQLK